MDGVAPPALALEPEELGEAISHAQHELERAVREGGLSKDPMRLPLGALAVTLGAMHKLFAATVEQFHLSARRLDQSAAEMARQPISPDAVARLERAAATGAERRAVELARAHNLRTVLIAAGVLVGSTVAAGGLGYWRGHTSAVASIHETEDGLEAAFRTSPDAAAAWVNLMRLNDLPHALATCTGDRTFTDQLGSPSCLLPMRLEMPKPVVPTKPEH
jgi:hypothetical protein